MHYIWKKSHNSYINESSLMNNMPNNDYIDDLLADILKHMRDDNDEDDGVKEDAERSSNDIPNWVLKAFTEIKDRVGDDESLSDNAEIQTWFHKVKNSYICQHCFKRSY